MTELHIHDEFSRMMPTQTKFELAQLEDSIKAEGRATQPIIAWVEGDKRWIIDGHTRHEICTRLKLPFDVVEREFKSKREIRLFIFQSQFARRNLTDAARAIGHSDYVQLMKGPAKAKAKALANEPPLNVIAAAARDLKVSKATVKRDLNVAKGVRKVKKADPKLADAIVSGDKAVPKGDLAKLGQDKVPLKQIVAKANKEAPKEAPAKPAAFESKAAKAAKASEAKRLARIDLLEVVAEKLGSFLIAKSPASRRKLIGEVAEALGRAEGKKFAVPVEYQDAAPTNAAPAKKGNGKKAKAPVKSAADVAASFDD